jgi:ribosomal protein L9
MTRFYLNEKMRLDKALQLLTAALEKYNARAVDADDALKTALDEATTIYRELGKSNQESLFQSLKTEWITAQRGINPVTLEKVSIRRNEMINTIKFKIMQKAQQQLGLDVDEVDAVLKDATTLVSQIIIAALQAKMLSTRDMEEIKTEDEIENFWKKIGADDNIALGQKRVQLLINRFDALLIFGDLLQQLK